MHRALVLARRGEGRTSPNPAVGAVIVKQDRVVGEGFHRRAGATHAEVEALRQAGPRARGATLYATLEPCNHFGRTPPCCDAILAAGIRRVVVAMPDPNPITDGRGLRRLARAGVRVVRGVLEAEARALNEPFLHVMRTGRPLLIAKMGESLDGKIATARGESRWITSPAARRLAHRWRSRVDALLIGIRTVLRDDPRLTVRGAPQRPGRPIRIIVDSHLRTPPSARCLRSPTLIATTARRPAKAAALSRRGAEVLCLPARRGRVPLRLLCRRLAQRGVHSVLLEGGGELLAGALAERLVGRVVFLIAPILLGGRTAPSAIGGDGVQRLSRAIRLAEVSVRRVGSEVCVEGQVVYPEHRDGTPTRRARHGTRAFRSHVSGPKSEG